MDFKATCLLMLLVGMAGFTQQEPDRRLQSQGPARGGPSPARDIFAEIASQRATERKAMLAEPQPPVLPDTQLPWAAETKPFTPGDKLDSAEKLQAELARQRQHYEPFLADLAPKLPMERATMPIESFSWRIGTDADRADFSGVLSGQGAWKTVTIPHYGAPLGRAVTYYRREFELPANFATPGAVFLCFKGVDYKAHVFVNGNYHGSHEGFFAPFEFEITKSLRPGTNTLVVKVENDAVQLGNTSWTDTAEQGDKIYACTGPGYDDPAIGWHHCPPGMGIYQAVRIEARAPQHFHDLFIRPRREEGLLDLTFEVWNCTTGNEPVEISFSIYGRNFEATVCKDQKLKGINPAGPGVNFYRVTVKADGLRDWEPDAPWLYELHAVLRDAGGKLLDASSRHFGMRSFRIDEESTPKGRLYLNGREIRLRGANTMGHEQQCVIRGDFNQLVEDLLLAKVCNMNFLRLTQRPVQSEIYEYADMLGLMLQTDLPFFGVVRRNTVCEAIRQAGEMERLVRNSPASIMVTYINEPFQNAHGKPERHLQRDEMESFFECADRVIRLENPDRVIKAVDGDYDPPGPGLPDNHCYPGWYNGHGVDLGKLHQGYWQRVKPGWLYGCGEFGSEGLDPVNVMRRYYPKEWLPASAEEESAWTPERIVKAQTGRIHYMWFDTQHSLAGWVQASQAHQAWVTRLMTEAFRRDRNMNTFAIHLFIDAFPSGWMKAIMDVDRQPKPAYFAYREALTPLAANLHCNRKAFFSGETVRVAAWVCNDLNQSPQGATLHYQVEAQGQTFHAGSAPAQAPAGDSVFQGWLEFAAPAATHRTNLTVRLGLFDAKGKLLHDTALKLDLFPAAPALENRSVCVIGNRDGKAAKLAAELGLNPSFTNEPASTSVILIDDLRAFTAAEPAITRAVRAGAKAVFIELPAGTYRLGGDRVTIERAGMNPRHFVSRATGHPLVEGFAPDDFKFWFDAAAGGVRPLLATVFQAPGWKPVLISGQGDWAGNWGPVFAAAEKPDGRGSWLLCQVSLQGRLIGNPPARLFAQRLLQSLPKSQQTP